jgi:hypothetical protein
MAASGPSKIPYSSSGKSGQEKGLDIQSLFLVQQVRSQLKLAKGGALPSSISGKGGRRQCHESTCSQRVMAAMTDRAASFSADYGGCSSSIERSSGESTALYWAYRRGGVA